MCGTWYIDGLRQRILLLSSLPPPRLLSPCFPSVSFSCYSSPCPNLWELNMQRHCQAQLMAPRPRQVLWTNLLTPRLSVSLFSSQLHRGEEVKFFLSQHPLAAEGGHVTLAKEMLTKVCWKLWECFCFAGLSLCHPFTPSSCPECGQDGWSNRGKGQQSHRDTNPT